MRPQPYDEKFLCHKNNLLQKARVASDERLKELCELIQTRYEQWISCISIEKICDGDLEDSVNALNEYVEFAKEIEKSEPFFNWRSDFAASIIPEFLYRLIAAKLSCEGLSALYSTRASVVELTLLANSASGGWNVRRKNQDLCMGLRTATLVIDGKPEEFLVPLIVFEVKTNIDINKLNGLDFSAERLKRSFPTAKYFLVTETIDFSLRDNYAAGSIDEIYVLRKQLRSAARRKKDPLCSDVFGQLLTDITHIIRAASAERGHVYDRLAHGKLINVT